MMNLNGIQKTEEEARAYCAEMERLHPGEKWLPFFIPAQSLAARQFGDYAACRGEERLDYERGGATFLDVAQP